MEPPTKKCPKCDDKRWYQYSTTGTPHSKPCEVCCTHEGTPWKDKYTGKYFCLSGCGTEMPPPTKRCGKAHYYQEGFITCECGQGPQRPPDAMEGDWTSEVRRQCEIRSLPYSEVSYLVTELIRSHFISKAAIAAAIEKRKDKLSDEIHQYFGKYTPTGAYALALDDLLSDLGLNENL